MAYLLLKAIFVLHFSKKNELNLYRAIIGPFNGPEFHYIAHSIQSLFEVKSNPSI